MVRAMLDNLIATHARPQAREVDRYIGGRIRERRILLGLTQHQLSKIIDVTYQQLHKYEHGINRLSAGRLFDIAMALGTPIAWFFENVPPEGGFVEMAPRERRRLEFARNFALIENEKHREAVSEFARILALGEDDAAS